MIPRDTGAEWRDAYAKLEAILLDSTETPERRARARRALDSVRITPRTSTTVLQGPRSGNDALRTEAEYDGWNQGR